MKYTLKQAGFYRRRQYPIAQYAGVGEVVWPRNDRARVTRWLFHFQSLLEAKSSAYAARLLAAICSAMYGPRLARITM
jgi:hypothetical protein